MDANSPTKQPTVLASIGRRLLARIILFADALSSGQSLGKRLLSIATVNRNSRKGCSVSQSFTCNAGALLIVDWVWIFLESRTRLGDMFAKTIVIQTGNLTKVRSLADILTTGSPALLEDKKWTIS
ncbi:MULTISPECIES: hypothetical protein [unclassified Pseudomonas]|uniref:hypothetical protein n=1 Tax=unclassified Pseudomonas TaxID=196821 RepID=UPI000F56E499|nr:MULTISPECIES: hypothetical protein [unclassified Pseudomonas]AZF45453.1 hypothetical protein C4J86_0184 [Pseudomonas sp. R2-7-07]AZF56092.1 hypothetical protein C4J84_0182 [Pseudomonas sp. R11-23-07]